MGIGAACKAIVRGYSSVSLILRIVIGLVIGAVLALIVPNVDWIIMLGTLFVNALKGIAPILVFVLIMSALARARSGLGKRFSTVIVLYIVGTFLASLMAVIACFVFPVTLELGDVTAADSAAPSGIGEVLTALVLKLVSNPVDALLNANYIGILVWAICLGLAFKNLASDHTKTVLVNISEAVAQVVRWIINLAPFGILGLVYNAVSTSGMDIFVSYGQLLLLLVGTMLVVAFVMEPLVASIALRRNAWPLVLRCLKDSGITAFFTRSSAANIPVNMNLCNKLGLDQNFYSVSIPLGATINMSGASVTIAVMTLCAANTLGVAYDFPTAVVLSVLAAVGACGASGVPGGSLMLIPMACSLFGIGNDQAMLVVGVGFIIGVVQDSLETALNSSGDAIFTAVSEYREWIKEGRELPKFFGPNADQYAGQGDAKAIDDEDPTQLARDAKTVESTTDAAAAVAKHRV